MQIVLNIKQYLCTVLPLICVIAVCLSSLQTVAFGIEGTGEWLYAAVLILFGLSFLGASMLKGIGKEWLGIIAGLISLVIQSVCAVFLFSKECYTVERILWCNIIYSVVFLVICTIFIYRFCVYKKQLTNHLGMPLVAAFAAMITAVLCMFLKGIIGHILAVLISLVLSFAIHMVALIITGCVKENELSDFPQGNLLKMLGRMMGVYS